MSINFSKILFLNLIISILIYILFLNMNMDTDVGIGAYILLGFIASLFFKENLLSCFLKLMLINAIAFHFLSVLIAYLELAIIYDIFGEGYSYNLYSGYLTSGYIILYSYGYIAGIIPQFIREKIQKNRTL